MYSRSRTFSVCMVFVLLTIVPCCLAEEIAAPVLGRWKGHSIGTSILTKRTVKSVAGDKEETYYSRQILLGADFEGSTFVLTGRTDANGTFLKKPQRSREGAGRMAGRVLNRTAAKRRIDEISIDVEEIEYGPVFYKNVQFFRNQWVAFKGRPDLFLECHREIRDSFKGENYHEIQRRKVKSASYQQAFGKQVLLLEIEDNRVFDGILRNRTVLSVSPDLPKALRTYEEMFDEKGKLVRIESTQLVEMKLANEEIRAHRESKKTDKYGEKLPWDSEYEQWRVEKLIEQGYSREKAVKNVRKHPTQKIVLENTYRPAYNKVSELWEEFENQPNRENRQALLTMLIEYCRDSRTFRGPDAEVLANEMAGYKDPEIQIKSMALLAYMSGDKYRETLEQLMIAQNSLDPEGLAVLLAGGLAPNHHVANVLSKVDKALDGLPRRYLGYSLKERAVPEIIKRIGKSCSYEKSELLTDLSSFDSDRARAFVLEQAKGIKKSDFYSADSNEFAELFPIIEASCRFGVDGIQEMFLRWLEWCSGMPRPKDTEARLRHNALRAVLIKNGIVLHDLAVNKSLRKFVKKLPKDSIVTVLLMASKNEALSDHELEVLADLKLDFSAKQVREILATQALTPFGFGPPAKFAPGVFAYLSQREQPQVLSMVMKEIMPGYSADLDLQQAWMEYNKSWYLRRTGKKGRDFGQVFSSNNMDFFANLPAFGQAGREMLRHLYQWDPSHRYLYPAIRKVKVDRTYWMNLLKSRQEELEEIEFERDLTLWCLGDSGMAQRYKHCRSDERNHSKMYRVYEALPYLPKEELMRIINEVQEQLQPEHRVQLAPALSRHKTRKCVSMLVSILDEQVSPSGRIWIAQLVNRSAGRNFGMRREHIQVWAESLPK